MKTIRRPVRPPHLGSEVLEEYVFERLSKACRAKVSDHLRMCSRCRHSLEDVKEFIRIVKAAAADYQVQSAAQFKALSRKPTSQCKQRGLALRLGA